MDKQAKEKNKLLVNVAVANIYREPTYRSELISQGILGEELLVLEKTDKFFRVKLEDGYEGWINHFQVCDYREIKNIVRLRKHSVRLFSEPAEDSLVVRDAVIGCKLEKVKAQNSWIQIRLPDNLTVWQQTKNFEPFPGFNRSNVVNLAKELLGYPYFWGGKSPKGFDCSGFTQCVFGLLGEKLPRDSWMQLRDGQKVKRDFKNALPGDLLFFAEDHQKVDHVGIALGNQKVIHARGMVRINSFNADDPDFSTKLVETYLDLRSYF